MENNNRRGVFYGVIGVATLVVAIIGATFAYFSAQANSANNVITAGATVLSLNITSTTNQLKDEMIPVETNGMFKSAASVAADDTVNTEAGLDAAEFPKFPNEGTVDLDPVTEGNQFRGRCKDLLGNNICSIYTFEIENPSSSASQQIFGFLTVKTNEFTNLKYAVYKGDYSQVDTWTVNGDNTQFTTGADKADGNGNYDHLTNGEVIQYAKYVPATGTTTTTVGGENHIPSMTVTLAPQAKQKYTILLWIEETGLDQTSIDSKITENSVTRGRIFEGGIIVTTDGGGTGVTGTLRLA